MKKSSEYFPKIKDLVDEGYSFAWQSLLDSGDSGKILPIEESFYCNKPVRGGSKDVIIGVYLKNSEMGRPKKIENSFRGLDLDQDFGDMENPEYLCGEVINRLNQTAGGIIDTQYDIALKEGGRGFTISDKRQAENQSPNLDTLFIMKSYGEKMPEQLELFPR